MDITTKAGALFGNHPRRKNKALLLDITIVNSCASSKQENAARRAGKHRADAVKRKKYKYRSSFPATYSLLPLAMSTCGEVGSHTHTLIKELLIRRVEHRSEIHSNESQHLAERKKVACLRRRFYFVFHQALSFHTRHNLCRQGVALAGTRQLRSQGPMSVHVHCTDGVTGSEGREGAHGGGNGDGNGEGGGAGTGTEVEASERPQDGSRNEAGTGTGAGIESRGRTRDGNGDGKRMYTREVTETMAGTGTGRGTESETGKRTRMAREGEEEENSGIRFIEKKTE